MTPKIQIVSPIWPSATTPSYGVFVANIARCLAAAGVEVDVVAVVRGRPLRGLDRVRAHLGLGVGLATSAVRSADCLYVHAPTWFGIPSYLASLPRGKRLVLHLHGAETYPRSRVEQIARPGLGWLARRADLVVVPSRYFEEEARRLLGVSASRVFVSPSGGVDLSTFRPVERAAARRLLSLPERGPIIGYVGRIDRDKGWDTVIEVVAKLARAGRRVHGVVVGEGAEEDAAHRLARKLGVEAELTWFGLQPQSKLVSLYGSFDVLLFPSRRPGESLGLVPIEAMAMGATVVASRDFAAPEYVADQENGYLCDSGSADEFADAVCRALDRSEEEVERMRAEMVRRAGEYDARRVAERLAGRLRRLCRPRYG